MDKYSNVESINLSELADLYDKIFFWFPWLVINGTKESQSTLMLDIDSAPLIDYNKWTRMLSKKKKLGKNE